MNLQIGRDQSVESLGPVPVKISEQVAYHMAPLLEVLGISSISIRKDDSIGGPVTVVSESDFFEGVPNEILKWSEPAVHSIGSVMSAFGIMSMVIKAENEDAKSLSDVWLSMLPVPARTGDIVSNGVREWGFSDTPDTAEVYSHPERHSESVNEKESDVIVL